jgi:hypothetical protein
MCRWPGFGPLSRGRLAVGCCEAQSVRILSLTSAVSRRRVQTIKAPSGAWHDTRDRWAERRSAVLLVYAQASQANLRKGAAGAR